MTTPRYKAASLWFCDKCRHEVRTQPGMEMLGRRCGVSICIGGKLTYRGGCFVGEGSVEFSAISDYYLVGVRLRENKTQLDRAAFHPRNRMRGRP